MLRQVLILGLVFAAACSSGDDEVVTIPDSGLADAGETADAGVDAGVSLVEMQTFGARYTEQGCSNGCLIRNFALTVTLRNNNENFQINKVEGLQVEIGTFVMVKRGMSCDGNWWRAPKNGSTAAQRISANLFDVADGDMTRNDNATVSFDCQASGDGEIVNMYMDTDMPASETDVKITFWGEFEDNMPWQLTAEATANLD